MLKKIRNKVLRSPVIHIDRKLNVIKALLYAKGLSHAGTWRQLNSTEARKVNTEIMRIYRTMLGYTQPIAERASDNSIIDKLNILYPYLLSLIFVFIFLFVLFLLLLLSFFSC